MIKKAARGLVEASDRTAIALVALAGAGLILLTIVITFGVVMRFVFSDSQNWTDELASYCLLWIVFFGLAYTLKTDGHIRIDFFTDQLPQRTRAVRECATYLIGLVFAALLFFGCWTTVQNFIRRDTHSTSGLDIPLYLPATALLIGSAAFGLAMLARALQAVTENPKDPPVGEGEDR